MFKANSKHCGLPARAEKPLPHLAWVGQDVFWGRERKRVRLGLLSLLGRGALGRRSLGRAWLHNPDKAGHAGVEPPHGHLLLYEAAPAAHDNLEIKRRTRKKKKPPPQLPYPPSTRTHARASKQANKQTCSRGPLYSRDASRQSWTAPQRLRPTGARRRLEIASRRGPLAAAP